MHLLALACLLDFCFVLLFKLSQRLRCAAPVVVCVNYLTIACLLALYLIVSRRLDLSGDVARVGIVAGTAFICSLSLMTWALEVAHVAVVLVAFRLSLIVPILASLWLWNETAHVLQFVGLGAAVMGLWLVTRAGAAQGGLRGRALLAIVVAVFLLQGTSHTCMRWIKHAGLDVQHLNVLMVICLTAGVLGALRVAVTRYRPRGAEWTMGVGIGLFNMVALTTVLATLARFDAVVFFPVVGCVTVILDSLAAHFLWKERMRLSAWGGVGLAVVAIILVLGAAGGDGKPKKGVMDHHPPRILDQGVGR